MAPFADSSTDPTRADLRAPAGTVHGESAHRDVIEQAKGALMVTYGLTADQAFDRLRFQSQSSNVKVRAIADRLTSLLSTRPACARATIDFDRLIDDVTRSLQAQVGATNEAVEQVPWWSAWRRCGRAAVPSGKLR